MNMPRKTRRRTKLELQQLALKLAVADIIADDDEFAAGAKVIVGGDDLDHDFVWVVEEAFRIAEYRLENLNYARDQARTPEILLQRVIDKRRSDGGDI
jgi:hypothetical protein